MSFRLNAGPSGLRFFRGCLTTASRPWLLNAAPSGAEARRKEFELDEHLTIHRNCLNSVRTSAIAGAGCANSLANRSGTHEIRNPAHRGVGSPFQSRL